MNRSPNSEPTPAVAQLTPACLLLAEEVWGSALHAMRSLAATGARVYVATTGSGAAIYRSSRACAAAADFDISDPHQFCSEVRDWIGRMHSGDRPVLVLPLSDRLVAALDASREQFPSRFRLVLPTHERVDVLLDKARQLRLAERAGLHVAPWVAIAPGDDLGLLERIRLPAIIKPTSWRTTGDSYFKLIISRDADSLRRDVANVLARGAVVIVQEYIDFYDDDVVFALVWSGNGSRHLICTGRKRRQSNPDGGVLLWGDAMDLPDVAKATTQFLEAAEYRGLGGAEFIRARGQLWFVEFNPRPEAFHFVAARAGLDTIQMAYREMVLQEDPELPVVTYPAAVWMGTGWMARLVNRPSDWRLAVKDRVAFGRYPRRVRAIWSLHDPRPGLAIAGRLAKRGAAALVRGRRSSDAS